MIILLDMDGVIVDIEQQLQKYSLKYFGKFVPQAEIEAADGTTFQEIISIPTFFETMEPITGALETITHLNKFFELHIVTAPGGKNMSQCIAEKQLWVEKYLPFLKNKVTTTKSKYLIQGDYLIDDMLINLNVFPNKTICFEQIWNKNKKFIKEPTKIVKSWQEILNFFLP